MEINTQNMEALLHLQEQQAQLPRKQNGQTNGFDALLERQISAQTAGLVPDNTLARTPGMFAPVMLEPTEDANTLDADSSVLMEAFNQASGTLDLWDNYRQVLNSSNTNLRDAWGVLQSIDSQVSQMRNNPALSQNHELDSLLNELEILTATEKFKFNRGDYIS